MEFAYAHEGIWPDALLVTMASMRLRIRPAGEVSRRCSQSELMSTVVVCEPFDQSRGGAWVGYADGHLEWVAGPSNWKTAGGSWQWCNRRSRSLARFADRGRYTNLNSIRLPRKLGLKLNIRVLGPDGRAIAGARLGISGSFGDLSTTEEHVKLWTRHDSDTLTTDADDRVTLTAIQFFDPDSSRYGDSPYATAALYVLDSRVRSWRRLETVALSR